jgi:hypothetical protein
VPVGFFCQPFFVWCAVPPGAPVPSKWPLSTPRSKAMCTRLTCREATGSRREVCPPGDRRVPNRRSGKRAPGCGGGSLSGIID